MRAADKWEAYRVIDASDGEKLEIWNGVSLIRPDPQVIWKTDRTERLWREADAHYHRSQSGGGKWEFHAKLPDAWELPYRDLTFRIRPTGFKHTGLFPEQAVNWDFMDGMIRNAGRPVSVLNLFAYTGGATLACANAGASVCHVDASKGMVQWARDNAALSGLGDKPIRWIVDDCEKFTLREIRRDRRYDAVIMDPPSYGRGPGGEVWKLENCIYDLVKSCVDVLSDKPLFFLINSYTTGLSPSVMGYILGSLLTKRFGGHVYSDEIGLPVEACGMCLPCGSTAVWCADQQEDAFYGRNG
ncbi:MAG: class I SAM-dependent methyltransferase [Oscillospiraceae bacterium]|nr:class I SAM-dependent methyltransferase [Oscillospiraceae bacterium]